ncbi:unnamed protein product [Rotaria sp. Silwood1]|nr:unnamed protein product [Rotaria sp. Silwood1]CAF1546113.1 unnamed protein product [Rotaria sp. Silwood1]
MTETKIENTTYSTKTVEHSTSPVLINNSSIHSVQNTNNIEIMSGMQHQNQNYQLQIHDITNSPLINRQGILQCSSSTHNIDQLANQTILPYVNQYPLNQDPYPEHIHRPTNEHLTYHQDIAIRYLQPPSPPPPGPIVVREIRAPLPPEAPPLVVRQHANVPMTPPPMIIRECPPVPPPIEPPSVVNKFLPAPPPLPRRVIIEREAPLPPKPQPVIIEKWLPYKPPPERRIVVEPAAPLMPRPIQKNTIITYDAPHVDIVKNVRHLGVVRADPLLYTAQYGPCLQQNEYVQNTMAKFGLGNNYMQMIQMQTTPYIPLMGSNQLEANYARRNSQQSMTMIEQNTSNIHQMEQENQHNYIENHAGVILPDHHQSSMDSLDDSDVFL